MADRIAEQGALQDAISNNEINPPRLSLAGYIRGLFLDWSASPYNPLTRLTAKGRYLGYFWDNGAIGLSMDFANQSFIVKDGTLQSKSFSDIVNFSRTSNATVTRSDGTIGFAPHNLLTFSEQFDNAAWTKTRSSITANTTTAPNGTTTADSLVEDTTASNTHVMARILGNPLGAGTYTYSVYLKSNGRRYVQLLLNVDPTSTVLRYAVMFDLQDGVVTNTASGNSPTSTGNSIQSVGNGWYRCAITIGNPSGLRIDASHFLSTTSTASITGNTYTGDGVSGAFVWGADLEIGSTATTYNPTTVKNLLGFSELFDNAAWTKSNSFVQTNLVTNSEAFSSWVVANISIVDNDAIAPNGYQSADKITDNSTNASHNFYRTVTVTSGIAYTISIYAKRVDLDYIAIGTVGAGTGYTYFNIANGTVGTTLAGHTASITPAENGYYRCSITATTTGTSLQSYFALASADGTVNYIGTGSSALFWGAQLVQGSVAGDYRRTDAAALPVYYPNHNGVVVAEKLVTDTATALHFVREDFTGVDNGVYTASIYAKAGEWNSIQLEIITQAGNVKGIVVNLLTGAISTGRVALPTSYGATAVGNGWYRVWITNSIETGATAERVNIFATNNSVSGNVVGDGTSGIYIFGAQLSDSASLDPYVLNAAAAPTAAAYYAPRFDYDPVTLQPKGLLIEEQRVNLLLRSEEFDNASWSKTNTTVVANSATSPDGTVDADTMIEDAGVSQSPRLSQSVTLVANTTYTMSAYVKNYSGTRNVTLQIRNSVSSNLIQAIFNLATQTAVFTTGAGDGTYQSSSITSVGNGWYKLTLTGIPSASTTAMFANIRLASGTSAIYTGDGTSGVYVWGAQVELGAFATSYIPTVASQVTRTADVATIQGSNFFSWYNQNEGSALVNGLITPEVDGVVGNYYLSLNDGTVNNEIRILDVNGSRSQIVFNGTTQFDSSLIGESNLYKKMAISYKLNDSVFSVNGSIGTVDNSNTTPIVNRLLIGVRADLNASTYANGHIKSLSYYPIRLSNDVLRGLTA